MLRPLHLPSLLLLLVPAFAQQEPDPASSQSPLLSRLTNFYRQDWTQTAADAATPERRGIPSPLSSPPFPSADWGYGGSPTLGEPDSNSYPLMAAINENRSRTKLYGWFDPTVNASSSTHSNAPVANDPYSNRLELNQFVLYLERLPGTVQRDHIDIGFHLTALYGTDYRYTTDKGYFSSQLLKHNRQYGFDPSLEYLDIYLPHLGLSTNIRIGRFISIPGIEAQLSPNNYFFSHSLLYSIDPFTDTGVLFTTQVNQQWLVQYGITASHDVAPWDTTDAKPSFTGCVSYTTSSAGNNVYLCANGINSGRYAFNNLQQYDATWYHKFSPGSRWHSATEAYVMYQRDVPSISGQVPPETGTNPAACAPGFNRCLAPVWAVVSYLNRQLDLHSFIGIRSDLLNDKKGQRTGYATKYTENTVSYNRWIGSTIQFRPEVRFDHAWDRKAYDRGARQNQFTGAADLILHF